MSVMIVTAKLRPEVVGEVEAAGATVFDAFNARRPDGIRYASRQLVDDGATFVATVESEADDTLTQIMAVPEYAEFKQQVGGWPAEPPTAETATVVGSYRLFGFDRD